MGLQDMFAAKVSARFLGYELSLQQLVKDVEWVEGPRRWAGLLPGRMRRIEHALPWYTGNFTQQTCTANCSAM